MCQENLQATTIRNKTSNDAQKRTERTNQQKDQLSHTCTQINRKNKSLTLGNDFELLKLNTIRGYRNAAFLISYVGP